MLINKIEKERKIDFIVHVFGGRQGFSYKNLSKLNKKKIDYYYTAAEKHLSQHGVTDFEDLR